MKNLYETHFTHPLEREYEAWIVNEIEGYFKSLNIPAHTFAVSPNIERNFPVDELSCFEGKIVGLQFKRASIAEGKASQSKLYWNFHNPPNQLYNVVRFDEIYYCLPTFIDRNFRHSGLHHCLFWKPNDSTRKRAWYNNPRVRNSYPKLKDCMRWGFFVEELFNCNVGVFVKRGSINSYLESRSGENFRITEPLYYLLVEL